MTALRTVERRACAPERVLPCRAASVSGNIPPEPFAVGCQLTVCPHRAGPAVSGRRPACRYAAPPVNLVPAETVSCVRDRISELAVDGTDVRAGNVA